MRSRRLAALLAAFAIIAGVGFVRHAWFVQDGPTADHGPAVEEVHSDPPCVASYIGLPCR